MSTKATTSACGEQGLKAEVLRGGKLNRKTLGDRRSTNFGRAVAEPGPPEGERELDHVEQGHHDLGLTA